MTTYQQHIHDGPPAPKPTRRRPYKRRPPKNPFLCIPSARTREGRDLRMRRAELIKHCGGAPSATQSILIDRITNLEWQSMQLDRLAAHAAGNQAIEMLERADKLANTLGRCLSRLSLSAAVAKPMTDREITNMFLPGHE